MRRKLSIVLAVVLSVGVGATIIESRRVAAASHRARVYGVVAPDARAFFADSRVRAEFARHRIDVIVSATGRDFALTADGQSQARFSTPLVVSAPTSSLPALERAGLVHNQKFDLARYMALAHRQQAPALIASPSITSTAGALFAAVAGEVANGTRMPASIADVNHIVNLVSPLFRVGAGTLRVDTEAALLASQQPNTTLLSPEPAISAVHAFVSQTPRGQRVLRLLATDATLRNLAAQHGFEPGGTAVSATILDAISTRVAATLRAGA